MRYAVLADVHANLHALRAALARLERERIDRYLVAGDLVGYGPLPDECVELIAELGATCIAGNHDLMALGELSDERCIALARRSLRWTREVMAPSTRDYLAALPARAALDGGIVMAHGSLDDPQEYVTEPAQATAQLMQLAAEHPAAHLLVVGHTHRAWACDETGAGLKPADGVLSVAGPRRHLLNPGAIGQARERRVRSRFAVVDTERAQATYHAVEYDVHGCREALRERGLPPGSYRLRRSALAGAARAARAVRRRLNR